MAFKRSVWQTSENGRIAQTHRAFHRRCEKISQVRTVGEILRIFEGSSAANELSSYRIAGFSSVSEKCQCLTVGSLLHDA